MIAAVLSFVLSTSSSPASQDEHLPAGFVYLRHVDPTITQAIRYAGAENFTGKPVPGYQAAECIIVRDAARALRRVQATLKSRGIGLKVFDCYRPTTAVAAFVRWAVTAPDRNDLKERYHPGFKRGELFPAYIARRSGHSRGGSVDLTLIELSKQSSGDDPLRDGCGPHPGGAELEMGTGFDCFDAKSQTAAKVSAQARKNRNLLLEVMRRNGFRNYVGEWWHFTLEGEPYRRTYFDFPVTAPPGEDR